MYPIIEARKLADKIFLMVVEAPRIAKNGQPGEFVDVYKRQAVGSEVFQGDRLSIPDERVAAGEDDVGDNLGDKMVG